jgi:hypothetical protein
MDFWSRSFLFCSSKTVGTGRLSVLFFGVWSGEIGRIEI